MSRSTHQRQQQKLQLQQQQQQLMAQQQQMAENDAAAAAAEMFDLFCVATTMRQVLGLHRNMCDLIGLRPAPLNEFYPKLKAKIRSWKAQALWKKFDARAAHRAYAKGNACTGARVLVIGAGPCGLRTAIEAQLLGAKVVVVEKRDRISRNNVLHLWPFVITDLRNLGAKKFYGKFCAGSIDHISIRQLQCILLKVALLLGVEVHEGVSFDGTVEPSDGCGWHASVTPTDHAVSHYEFDVLIGADGKRNTLEGFKRKEFRGKLAIAITANFINKKTEAEAKAEEISGVAFIFNQSFFKELYHTTGIDLENIVYYKDETHYFVMTAKKHSLIDKGVIMHDFADPAELLAPVNVNTEKLLDYAREAANFSTKYQMPNLEFAVNHYGKPDVAMFDFTSMFAAETSCRVIMRNGFRLLQCLVGDSLLEPFWPTGSGCARGFLSSMDAAYAIKLWSNTQNSTLGVLAQRESIYRLLNQTTPENLQRDIGSYTVDPASRYPNLNRTSVNVWQVKHLIDTDDPAILEQTFMDTNALQATQTDTTVRRKRRSGDSLPLSAVLLRWICAQLHSYDFTKTLKEVSDVFTNGKVLCALINRYRPDLVDFNAVKDLPAIECNDIAFKILEKELNIPRIMSGKDSMQLNTIELKLWLNYLEQICEVFRGEIPHVKHPKMDFTELREKYRFNPNVQPDFSKLLQISTKQKAKAPMQDMVDVPQPVRRSVLDEERLKRQRKHAVALDVAAVDATGEQQEQAETPRRAKKRRSAEKAANIDRERSDIPSALPRNATDEQFSDRIKSMEQRITSRNNYGTEKKPKDLMRAIGKIDSSDWNVREIEKKIEQSKKTEINDPKGREKVPKWSKEQFMARQHKMSRPIRQDSGEEKFKEIDQTLKNFDKQLKEGSVLEVGERGRNKVASIAGQFVKKDDTSDEKNPPTTVVQKPSTKVALAFKKQAASEKCHFCKQIVYLMEKINTEGLILHRSCLKCHHCHTNLRPGGYAFDRDDPIGRFYCTQHFRLPAKAIRPVVRKPGQRKPTQQQQAAAAAAAVNTNDGTGFETPDKLRGRADSLAQLDLLDRGQTPERIEFENTDAMSDGEPSEEHIIDENEWSGRNFLPESNNDSESDLSSSDDSNSDSDSDIFEEANDSPLGVQTLQLATDWIGKQNYSDSDDSDDFYDSSDGMADDGKDDTEGEEFKKARELRREEVRLLPLPANLPTDTETEVQSDSESSSSNKVEQNSATEISTDSEFDHDEIIRETPKIFIDDTHLKKPTKVQVKSTVITSTTGQKYHTAAPGAAAAAQIKGGSYLQKYQTPHQPIQPQFKPLVQVDPSVLSTNRVPLQNPRLGDYQLNKTASTEGIASKKSLELKKRYLLGDPANGNKIQKSGSTSVLDSKIRSFHSNISECQKLLNPGGDISSSMKTFLDRTKLGEHTSDTTNIINRQSTSTTGSILNDLKVEITIQKAASAASTDNEKENIFVNSKNELNKGMEYSETVNTTLVEALSKKSPTTPTPNYHPSIIETIDLVTPEKKAPSIIDLTQVEIPRKMLESNVEFINNVEIDNKLNSTQLMHVADSNKIIDLTLDSPVKNELTLIDDSKPDVSRGVKESIPDIIEDIETTVDIKQSAVSSPHSGDEHQHLLSNNSYDEEKKDSPEKHQHRVEIDEDNDLQIQVPNIPWNIRKTKNCSSISGSSCTSSNTSSIEDIQHYILDSTTSPDTQTAAACIGQVPRLEVHDTAGELMQIDSLMIIDGKYIGDPEDLKLMDIPEGLIIPALPDVKTTEVEDEPDIEPVTSTPEPADRTVIETVNDLEPPPLPEHGPPLPAQGPPIMKPIELKFDTRNENKVESLKNLPLIVDQVNEEQQLNKAIKPITLNLSMAQKPQKSTTPTAVAPARTPLSPLIDNDKTPTAELLSRGSDSETEATGTGTGQVLTETELSDWTADDCISENFIDIEFVLNSNKGTIKRNKNKKAKKKHASFASKLSSGKDGVAECSTNIASVTEFEGILQNLDIDEIEFMDTGSEGSYAEAYSATNTAMLRNRGYIEFIETNASKATPTATSKKISDTTIPPKSTSEKKPAEIITMRDEVLGIDYIEQGAYIMQRDDSQQDLLKTPVNEEPHTGSVDKFKVLPPINSLLSQSLTDSSTLNDDDSLGIITPNSQAQLTTSNSGKSYTKTTTEESEALTVVTSPLDSSSPKLRELVGVNAVSNSNNTGSTPSSSDKNPKTSLSTCTPSSTSTASSSNATSPRRNFSQELVSTGKPSTSTASSNLGPQRNPTDELSYEDYVRALQQKITQISSACGDSFDSRKQRRKSSKGETPIMTNSSDTQTVIEQATNQRGNSSQLQTLPSKLEVEDVSSAIAEQREIAQAHKVPEIPTLSRRLEEITKERTKQKDLIHDLVMDKLQSKKQLNAEKRLHRSRQRTILTSGMSGFGITGSVSINTCGSSLSPTPKLAAASTTTDTNCTNQAHYHVSTASNTVQPALLSSSSSFKEANPPQKSGAYIAAYHRDAALSPTRSTFHKQRPFSEHIGAEQLDALEPYRLTKAPSFSYIMSTSKHNPNNQIKTFKDENTIFSTPVPPQRPNPNHIAISPTSVCNPITASASTDKLRSEARARARLKSNNELGLSPEEKMLLLRKRLNIEDQQQPDKLETKQINARDRKMSTSKSVNDLSTVSQFASQLQSNSAANEYSNTIEKSTIIADFTSDPNLLLSSSSAQTAAKPLKEKSMPSRRQKDPERRKSIIQSLSSFFHMGNSGSNNGGSNKKDSTFNVDAIATAGHSAQPERPGTSGSSTTSGSVDGVFSRFRMSSKTKEKSKENRTPINAATSSPTASTAKTGTKANYERSISQDCILNSKNSNIKHHSHSHHHNINKIIKASTASTYSSSSPQLFITKATAHNAAADNQTPPPIPPLPLHYQRSDDESYATETREQKKQRSISKAIRQAELKRLRIAQEIQREQEEIEVQLKELEARGVLIEKALRGESQPIVETTESITMGASDEKLLKELLDIWRNITQLKKRDEELGIRQQELQLEHRHAQLKEELNIRLSSNKIDKSSSDVAAEGAILNEMLEIVAKRAALRPTTSPTEMEANTNHASSATGGNMNIGMTAAATTRTDSINLLTHGISYENSESNI